MLDFLKWKTLLPSMSIGPYSIFPPSPFVPYHKYTPRSKIKYGSEYLHQGWSPLMLGGKDYSSISLFPCTCLGCKTTVLMISTLKVLHYRQTSELGGHELNVCASIAMQPSPGRTRSCSSYPTGLPSAGAWPSANTLARVVSVQHPWFASSIHGLQVPILDQLTCPTILSLCMFSAYPTNCVLV